MPADLSESFIYGFWGAFDTSVVSNVAAKRGNAFFQKPQANQLTKNSVAKDELDEDRVPGGEHLVEFLLGLR